MLIVTNLTGMQSVVPSEWRVLSSAESKIRNPWGRVAWLYRYSYSADYLVLNFSTFDVLVLALLFTLRPPRRCRLVTLDLFLNPSSLTRFSLRQPIERWLLNRVDLFLVFVRDVEFYRRHYNLDLSKFRYVPYKVNGWELILQRPTHDDGYIFCGGKSRRDFATLFDAIRPLDYPLKLITGSRAQLLRHGSILPDDVPPQVEILPPDASTEEFVRCMAGARLVVLPLRGGMSQAGIAVYLMAMALGKCVIISAGPGIIDVLEPDQALMVPPEDPQKLRLAIQHAWENDELRMRIAANGMRYARSLGGTRNLLRSVVTELERDLSRTSMGVCTGVDGNLK